MYTTCTLYKNMKNMYMYNVYVLCTFKGEKIAENWLLKIGAMVFKGEKRMRRALHNYIYITII